MSQTQQPDLFPAPVQQATWQPAPGRHACTRDPQAGPGTCWYWWEGCPKAEKRGCHLVWKRMQREVADG
jgi:hypothetical protein